ncbi:MAG TPA: trypsin-like peptidase domain-containing protein [Candidatus Angelobacter sp.]|nr:trypsin-like peptidase domain-containing protein [Candidatus Angelobacter sp.]
MIKLRAHHANGSDETAAGLFVGKDAKSAYFITARHALRESPDNQDSALVRTVEIQFAGKPARTASVFAHSDLTLDLAVVQIGVEQLPPGLPEVPHLDATPDAAVVIVGHPPAGDWSAWSGVVQNESWSDDAQCFTTNRDQSLVGGYSGGPVFDACGNFLGMHRATTASYGVALKESAIEKKLRAWGAPANNLGGPAVSVGKEDLRFDEDAIQSLIDRYAAAYEARDPQAVFKVWSDPPAKAKENISRALAAARSISMKVTNVHIAVTGTTATASGQYAQEYTPKSGGTQRSSGAIGFKLRKACRLWVIESIN